MGYLIAIGIVIWAIVGIYNWLNGLITDKAEANRKLDELKQQVDQLVYIRDGIESKITNANNREIEVERWANKRTDEIKKIEDDFNKRAEKVNQDLDELVTQRSAGFPLLGEVYQEYFDIKSKINEAYLKNKQRPARKAAEILKESTKEKKELIFDYKVLEKKLKNYEAIAPYLTEASEEDIPSEDDRWILEGSHEYTEEEAEDMATRFLTIEEYKSLSNQEKYQIALDRYWSRRKRSKWLIGKMYERFVGFLYEQNGYQVEYFGIKEKYEDLGRDIIAKKGKKIHIIQCKNWSKYKTIYENHIFQLFGTTFEYSERNKVNATPVFYTTTKLSKVAAEMCDKLGISLVQEFPLKIYPSIKCNISRKNGEKIYHLPFDQQYDNITIEKKKGESYCETVAEAEKSGFRRAFRWHGEN